MRCLQAPRSAGPAPDCQQHRTQGVEPENGDTRCSTDRCVPWGPAACPLQSSGARQEGPSGSSYGSDLNDSRHRVGERGLVDCPLWLDFLVRGVKGSGFLEFLVGGGRCPFRKFRLLSFFSLEHHTLTHDPGKAVTTGSKGSRPPSSHQAHSLERQDIYIL